jgi:hypothetical protein
MKFAVIGLRRSRPEGLVVPAHREYLTQQRTNGKLVIRAFTEGAGR